MIASFGPKFTYDDNKHEYRFGSEIVPGITQIIQPYTNFGKIPKQILADKQAWGNSVHKYLEMLDNDRLDVEAIPEAAEGDPNIRAVVENWAQICHNELYFWLAIEKPLYSNLYRFAGTADRITTKEPIEIKTSLPRKATGVQLAFQAQLAFENGYIEEIPQKLHSWHTTEQGVWTQKEYDFKECWNIAMCLLTAGNFFRSEK